MSNDNDLNFDFVEDILKMIVAAVFKILIPGIGIILAIFRPKE